MTRKEETTRERLGAEVYMNDLSPNDSQNSYEEYKKIHKDALHEKLFMITHTDPRMSESQKSGFYKAFWDLMAQEPTLEEMDIALNSYVAHFDHVPSPHAFAKHFGRFRTGLMPNKKGTTLKKMLDQQSINELEDWIKEHDNG